MKSVLSDADLLIQSIYVQNLSLDIETQILIKSLHNSFLPKLVKEDISKLLRIIEDIFPHISAIPTENHLIIEAITKVTSNKCLLINNEWFNKVIDVIDGNLSSHLLKSHISKKCLRQKDINLPDNKEEKQELIVKNKSKILVKGKICLPACLTNSGQILNNSRKKAVVLRKIEIRTNNLKLRFFKKLK
jgi:hypothetical protein